MIRAIIYVRCELSPNYVPLSPLPLKVGSCPPAPTGPPPMAVSFRSGVRGGVPAENKFGTQSRQKATDRNQFEYSEVHALHHVE